MYADDLVRPLVGGVARRLPAVRHPHPRGNERFQRVLRHGGRRPLRTVLTGRGSGGVPADRTGRLPHRQRRGAEGNLAGPVLPGRAGGRPGGRGPSLRRGRCRGDQAAPGERRVRAGRRRAHRRPRPGARAAAAGRGARGAGERRVRRHAARGAGPVSRYPVHPRARRPHRPGVALGAPGRPHPVLRHVVVEPHRPGHAARHDATRPGAVRQRHPLLDADLGRARHGPVRCARYAGLDDAQLAGVLGGQSRRLVDRADPLDLGPAPGPVPPLEPLLERLYVYLAAAVEATKRGETPGQLLDLARHCCRVRPGHPHRAVFDSVRELLDRYEQHAPHLSTGNQYAPGWDLVATAAIVARTPGTPLPDP